MATSIVVWLERQVRRTWGLAFMNNLNGIMISNSSFRVKLATLVNLGFSKKICEVHFLDDFVRLDPLLRCVIIRMWKIFYAWSLEITNFMASVRVRLVNNNRKYWWRTWMMSNYFGWLHDEIGDAQLRLFSIFKMRKNLFFGKSGM